MKFKKAQGTVSGLVILIGVLIVIYVLLIPPCDKCDLLDSDCPNYCEVELEDNVLLSVSPGEIYYSDVVVHNLNSVNLFIKYEPFVSELASSLEISKSWFGSLDQEFSFNLENLENLDSAHLSFLIMESAGDLYIYLNDKQVFAGKGNPGELKNVDLPSSYLLEDNILKMYVNPPGILFWVKNKYLLKDFKLNEESVRIHSSEERTFLINSEEKSYIKDSVLEYSVYCTELIDDIANLKIYLNEVQLSSEFVFCTSEDKSIEVGLDIILEGTNNMLFLVDDGNFLISDIKLKNTLEKEIFPNYSFEIDSTFGKNFIMLISFDSTGLNNLDVKINNELLNIETTNSYFEQDITNFIKSGKNYIELIPNSEIDINKLEIRY
jgi:hypothetical protein